MRNCGQRRSGADQREVYQLSGNWFAESCGLVSTFWGADQQPGINVRYGSEADLALQISKYGAWASPYGHKRTFVSGWSGGKSKSALLDGTAASLRDSLSKN